MQTISGPAEDDRTRRKLVVTVQKCGNCHQTELLERLDVVAELDRLMRPN